MLIVVTKPFYIELECIAFGICWETSASLHQLVQASTIERIWIWHLISLFVALPWMWTVHGPVQSMSSFLKGFLLWSAHTSGDVCSWIHCQLCSVGILWKISHVLQLVHVCLSIQKYVRWNWCFESLQGVKLWYGTSLPFWVEDWEAPLRCHWKCELWIS
jgi:hypothetical protein